jgi:uncharacterized C2H2 Zn-finger protein
MENNKIYNLLVELNLIDKDFVEIFYPKVRDRDDIEVLKCNKSGVIFLSSTEHINDSYYNDMDDFKYWGKDNRDRAILDTLQDDERRSEQFRKVICGKKWVDIGTGNGGILDILSKYADETHGVEPQNHSREFLNKIGYKVFKSIDHLDDSRYEVVTLFHVVEHLINPLEDLMNIKDKMVDSGQIIIEIPHANDFLISFLESESFKSFTFWSEHLILHTRDSIEKLLIKVGFRNIIIKPYQRYPLANHLHWLSKNKPGGHNIWHFLDNEKINDEYLNLLTSLDKTDTLIVIAQK